VNSLLPQLDQARLELALTLVSYPEQIRGFGHVKERNVKAATAARDAALQRWLSAQATPGGKPAVLQQA